MAEPPVESKPPLLAQEIPSRGLFQYDGWDSTHQPAPPKMQEMFAKHRPCHYAQQ